MLKSPFESIKNKKNRYNIDQLINESYFSPNVNHKKSTHILCDIDKTYLETQFESFIELAKIPFETAKEKITAAGAKEILLRLCLQSNELKDSVSPQKMKFIHFVSSSPPQLRQVLEEKMALDGIKFLSTTFKNQLYNLKKGRFSLLREQVSYKILAITNLMKKINSSQANYILIGDNAEKDPLIYLILKLYADKKISLADVECYLCRAGVEKEIACEVTNRIKDLPEIGHIDIYIRCIDGYRDITFPPVTNSIFFYNNYFEFLILMMDNDTIAPGNIMEWLRKFHNYYDFSLNTLYLSLKTCLNSVRKKAIHEEIKQILHKLKKFNIPVGKNYTQKNFCSQEDKVDLSTTEIKKNINFWIDMLNKRIIK